MTGLRVFQYRAAYVNGTPIVVHKNISSSAPLDQRLRLLEVAYVEENSSSLEFLSQGNIWPGKRALIISCVLLLVVDTQWPLHLNL